LLRASTTLFQGCVPNSLSTNPCQKSIPTYLAEVPQQIQTYRPTFYIYYALHQDLFVLELLFI